MIARDIIVGFCIISKPKYARMFGRNFVHDTFWGKIKTLTQHFAGGLTYNQFQNILRLFDVLSNFPFTTSEKMCDYYL